MRKPLLLTLALFIMFGSAFLMAQTTRSGWKPTPGSTTVWTLPATDSTGAFTSNGSGTVTLVPYQGLSGTNTITATDNHTSGILRVPNSATLPATCTVGDSYMDTDATSGARWYLCESTNTWASQGSGGSVPSSRTITIAGTANEITSSTGAQDLSADRTWTLSLPSTVNLSSKTLRVPNSATLPATCTVGDSYMDTDATSGQRWYLCESTDTWAVQGGAGGAGDITSVGDCTTGACDTVGSLRINPRVVAVSDATSITPAGDTSDVVTQTNTQATGTLTVNAPTGTPVTEQPLELRLKATNVQTFAWNAIYRGADALPLPAVSSSGASDVDRYKFKYHSGDTKWDLVAVTSDAYTSTIREVDLSLSDVTTADVSTSKHGFTPKAPNDTSKYLRGDGTWAALSGSAVSGQGARVERAATQAITTSTATAVSWDTEVWDNSSFWAAGTPTQVVVPATEWYSITATIEWDTNATGIREACIRVNGATYRSCSRVTATGGSTRVTVTTYLTLTAADYYEVMAFHTKGSNENITFAHTEVLRWIGGGVSSTDLRASFIAAQTIAGGNTITADSCGGYKRITSAGDVTTSTTDTFTAPASGNANCIMDVCNVGTFNITLDWNANTQLVGGANLVLATTCCIRVASSGASGVWKQTAAQLCSN